jgi:hypothetical protein
MMGTALVRKLRGRFEGIERGPFFSQLAADVEADLETLDTLTARLQIRPNVVKHTAGWVTEKASRLKLNPWFNGSPRLTVLSPGGAGRAAARRARAPADHRVRDGAAAPLIHR